MNSFDDINKEILSLVRDGKMSKELAFNILKELNRAPKDRGESSVEKNSIKICSEDFQQYKTVKEFSAFLEGYVNEVINEYTISKNTKIIENIEPFNELFYKNCFYNSCFPVIRGYGKSLLPLLVNDTSIYTSEDMDNELSLNVKYLRARPTEQIMTENGISIETKWVSEDIINDIIDSISNNRPAIVYIDCFYEAIRVDTYQKLHMYHTLLIYGYNLSNKTFNIIEHGRHETLDYSKRVIDFEDVKNGYNGFIENFKDQIPEPVFHSFYKSNTALEGNVENNRYKFDYLQGLTKNRDLILQGIEKIKIFKNRLERLLEDNVNFSKNGEEIINMLNSIINSKQVEKYKINAIFEQQNCEAIELLDFILEQWIYVRRILAKSIFSGIFDKNRNQGVLDAINQIYDHEIKYYDSITQCLSI